MTEPSENNRSPAAPAAGERQRLLSLLPGRAGELVCLDSVGSTNDYLRRMAEAGAAEGSAVIAREQTAGRGRLGRSFFSPAAEGLYLSLLLRPGCAPAQASQLTAWAAVAACNALERVCSRRPGIKWVNDLVLGGRKLAGILTETALEPRSGQIRFLILGLGINLSQRSFPPELEQKATSLWLETGRDADRLVLAAELLRQLDAAARDFPGKRAEYLAAYGRDCLNIGRELVYDSGGETRTGTALGLDQDFGLRVLTPSGAQETLRWGEVSVRGLCGYV